MSTLFFYGLVAGLCLLGATIMSAIAAFAEGTPGQQFYFATLAAVLVWRAAVLVWRAAVMLSAGRRQRLMFAAANTLAGSLCESSRSARVAGRVCSPELGGRAS